MATLEKSDPDCYRVVTIADPAKVEGVRVPDFLLVGPQRTGSTWLFEVLKRHSQVAMTEPKEIYFFNALRRPDHPLRVSTELSWYLDHFRGLRPSGSPPEAGVCGEGTATYAAGLTEDILHDVVTMNPRIRVVLGLRDPVARMWSHAKKDLGRMETGRSLEQIPDAEFLAFFEHWYHRACGFHSRQIELWSRWLKPDHLLAVRFEDIGTRPVEMVGEIARFLGVEDEPAHAEGLAQYNPNPTEVTPGVPERFAEILDEVYRDERVYLHQVHGLTT